MDNATQLRRKNFFEFITVGFLKIELRRTGELRRRHFPKGNAVVTFPTAALSEGSSARTLGIPPKRTFVSFCSNSLSDLDVGRSAFSSFLISDRCSILLRG